MSKCKTIGAVIALTGTFPGFVVRVERYGSGRKLPQPRVLMMPDGKPFASRFAAMDALTAWKADPKSVRQVKAADPVPVRTTRPEHVAPTSLLTNDMQDYEHDALHEKQRKAKARRLAKSIRAERERRHGAQLPVVVKMPPCPVVGRSQVNRRDKTDLTISQMIDLGLLQVTEVAEASRRRNYAPRRGGAVPATNDPRNFTTSDYPGWLA